MYCEKCGKQIAEGELVCENCGVNVKKNEENSEKTEIENYQAEETGAKKLKKLVPDAKFLITAVCIVLVVILATAVFPFAKNTFAKIFKSPEDYLSYVVEKNIDDSTAFISQTMGEINNSSANGFSANGELNLEVGDGFEKLIKDISGQNISEDIGWLKDAAFTYDINSNEEKLKTQVGAKLNKKNIGALNFIVDSKENKLYAGIEDYLKPYVMANVKTNDNKVADDTNEKITKVLSALPDEKLSQTLIQRYTECVLNSIANVQKSKEEIEAEGISKKVTKLSVVIDAEASLKIYKSFLSELKNDGDIRKIIEELSKLGEFTVDEIYGSINDEIESLENKKANPFEEIEVKIDVFVNSKSEVVGFSLSSKEVEFELIDAQKGNKFGTVIKLTNEDYSLSLNGTGKISGDKRTGKFDVNVSGIKVAEASIKKLNVALLKKGILNGEIVVIPGEVVSKLGSYAGRAADFSAFQNVSLTLKAKNKSFEKTQFNISIDYSDLNCATVTFKSDKEKAEKIEKPKNIVSTEDTERMKELETEFDTEKLFSNLRKAGIPEKMVEKLETLFKMRIN